MKNLPTSNSTNKQSQIHDSKPKSIISRNVPTNESSIARFIPLMAKEDPKIVSVQGRAMHTPNPELLTDLKNSKLHFKKKSIGKENAQVGDLLKIDQSIIPVYRNSFRQQDCEVSNNFLNELEDRSSLLDQAFMNESQIQDDFSENFNSKILNSNVLGENFSNEVNFQCSTILGNQNEQDTEITFSTFF